jgi:hypothetical protein
MTINHAIDLALRLNASHAFAKLSAIKARESAQIEADLNAIFGEPAVDAAAIACLENVFGA